ncbi:TIM barrel protein [Paenibacillus apiarius]|uniref:TIM barrel protein n=1 Tax=Paenibacillus apiarius TaxID=46240 RepID=UPI003B3B462E
MMNLADLRPRIGILTDEVSTHMDEALAWIAGKGLARVELRTMDGKNVMEVPLEQLKDRAAQISGLGMTVSCLASPVFKCALSPSRRVASGDTFGQAEEGIEAHFAMLDQAFRVAKMLGTTRIRIFSFWREENPDDYFDEIVRHLQWAAKRAAQAGMLLLLENEPACNGGFAAEVAAYVRAVGSPALKVLWDPGNEAYGGREAFPAGYGYVKDVLGHVHLKDAVYINGQGVCVPLGQGNVDYVQQLQALRRDGYGGDFTIEPHVVPEGGTAADGVELSLQGLAQIITAMRACPEPKPLEPLRQDALQVRVYEARGQMGRAAGEAVADQIRSLLREQREVRVVFAAAPSQNELLHALTEADGIDWSRITAFHMDEYIGLPPDSPQRFSQYLRDRLIDIVQPGRIHYIGAGNVELIEAECLRYAELLREAPLDIVCFGIGENGHLAFNDPPVADFNDPMLVKPVALDEACRQQQVNDGCFATIADVPTHALTLTIPALLSARYLYGAVPGPRKRRALHQAMHGPITHACPASALRMHEHCILFVDAEAFSSSNPAASIHSIDSAGNSHTTLMEEEVL